MRQIPLHGKNGEGKHALVDDDDFDRLSKLYWKVSHNGYVYREMKPVEGVRGARAMHHDVLGITDPDMLRPVDHDNRDKLDNRKENLIRTTPSINLRNRPLFKNNKLGIKYVRLGRMRRYGQSYIVRPPGLPQREFRTLQEATEYASSLKEQ